MIFETWQNWSQVIKIIGGIIGLWMLNEIRKNTAKEDDDDEDIEEINEDDINMIMGEQ